MKRTLAVIGFSMLMTLTVFCKVNNHETASGAIIVTLAVLFFSLTVTPLRKNMTVPTVLISVFIALCLFLTANVRTQDITDKYSDSIHTVKGTIASLPYKVNSQNYYVIKTSEVDGHPEKINIRISTASPIDLEPTDTITVKLNTFMLSSGDDSYEEYYKSKDLTVGATLFYEEDYILEKATSRSLESYILLLRYNLFNEINSLMPNDYGAVILGLVLGEKSSLSDCVSTSFMLCGVSHLFAVSGLHISIWSSLVYSALRKFGFRNKVSSIISIIFCLVFILLTGTNPPVVRAGFMMIMLYFSNLMSREADSVNSIGFSLIIMLFANPYCALSISLWLSLLATLGILLCYTKTTAFLFKPFLKLRRGKLKNFISYIISTVALCICVNTFTLPVYFFKLKSISLVLIPANFIMVFLGKICMETAGIGSIISLIGVKFLSTPLLFFAGIVSKTLIKCAEVLSSLENILVPVTSPVLIAVFSASLIILTVLFLFFKHRKKFIKITVLILSLIFVLSATFVYAKSFTTPEIITVPGDEGFSVVVKYNGQCAVIFADNGYYAAGNVCGIIKENAISKIDCLFVYTPINRTRKLISSYKTSEILSENSALKKEIYYTGKVSTLDDTLRSFSDLTVKSENGFCYIEFGSTNIVVCFDNYSLNDRIKSDILISPLENSYCIHRNNFGKVITVSDKSQSVKIKLSPQQNTED